VFSPGFRQVPVDVLFEKEMTRVATRGRARPERSAATLTEDQSAVANEGGGMASRVTIKVNGLRNGVGTDADTPLLYVLHNELHLHGP
jgi:hypothetical protein